MYMAIMWPLIPYPVPYPVPYCPDAPVIGPHGAFDANPVKLLSLSLFVSLSPTISQREVLVEF